MSFQEIIGQERAKRLLQSSLREDKLSHAYIFNGPSGTGKKQMARYFAKAIFCTQHKDDSCGECLECRKVEHSNHPHLHIIEPDGQSIKIEQIRELQKEFSYRTAHSQVYIIEQAERMTIQAANSLLKFLEEPQATVIAVLVTDNGQAILPTIGSRSQWVPFTPMAPAQMRSVLQNEAYPELLILPAVHIASGLGAARDLFQLKWFAEMRNVVIQLAKESIDKFATASVTAQNAIIKSELIEHIDILLDLFILWFKDMIHIHCGRKEQVVYIDQIEWLSKHAFTQPSTHWIHCMERAVETHKRLRFNANPQLALEQFMSHIRGG